MRGLHPYSGSSTETTSRVVHSNNELDSSEGGDVQTPLTCAHAFVAVLPLPAWLSVHPLVTTLSIHLKQRDIVVL